MTRSQKLRIGLAAVLMAPLVIFGLVLVPVATITALVIASALIGTFILVDVIGPDNE